MSFHAYKLLICGYSREDTKKTIPNEIHDIILHWYGLTDKWRLWTQQDKLPDIKFSIDGQDLINKKDNCFYIEGESITNIQKCNYSWTIKIINYQSPSFFDCGILNHSKKQSIRWCPVEGNIIIRKNNSQILDQNRAAMILVSYQSDFGSD